MKGDIFFGIIIHLPVPLGLLHAVLQQSINGHNIVYQYVYLLVFLERPVGNGYAKNSESL